ncbi:SDR family NAD(P)-dependent oxidoreductase [Nostoc sp. FACHB-888]|uniref:SDR family NAD(P)-dependent oxidoreductase n=1 Tax=Nostoc sp. FACHB-888 TaxID=2692842 RepID=UPI0016872C2A|nr:SDR family NAD(P)-dependent oxidoreductase [Nostoc sp. FACHB-888]MBD2248801.1 SDR family NAD(P)-dependent oxidoreductase [Nostoc sp. FACHB-888]
MGQSELKNKVALITGANKGLGLEMSRQLGQHGLKILIAGRNLEAASTAADKLQQQGVDAVAIALDIGDSNQIQSVVKEIDEQFGKLDILINNAGIFLDGDWLTSNASSISLDIIRQTFNTNFFALVELTQALLPLILKSPSGRIVNRPLAELILCYNDWFS